jgi:hypothetical protein
MPDIRVDLQ